MAVLREHVLVLRADVQARAELAGRARRNRAFAEADARRVEAVVELGRVELPDDRPVGRQPRGDEVMLDHADPAVVGALLIRRLAVGIGGLLVDLGEFDLLEIVLVVVDDRPDVSRGRHRALHDRLLGVAQELEIRFGRDRLLAVVGDVERHVDHVAAAMERQHLDDLVSVRRGRGEPEVHAVRARRQFAGPGQRLVHGLDVVGLAGADQSHLGDENALRRALQHVIGLRRVGRVAVLVERHERDDAARGIDFRRVQIGLDRDLLAASRLRAGRRWHARRGAAWPPGLPTAPARSFAGARRLRGRGALHLRRDRRRRVLRLPRLPEEERGERKDHEQDDAADVHHGRYIPRAVRARLLSEIGEAYGNGVEAPGMIRVTATDASSWQAICRERRHAARSLPRA